MLFRSLLILDEPINGLDIPSKNIFRKLLTFCSSDDRIVIISTHQARELENLINAIIFLDSGEIIFNKTVQEINNKILFKKLNINEETLYSEISASGKIGVVENSDETESPISLELLFNMTIKNKELVKSLFNESIKRKS